MAQVKERRGLGRGLSALMADVDSGAQNESRIGRKAETSIQIELINPNPNQPRRTFTDEALDELAASIREKGIIQPLILRPSPQNEGSYEIVAGERRWRAAQKARLHEVPAIVRDLDDTEVLEIAIIENIQRADLNAIEEAAGYRQLMDRFGHTQDRLAEALSKSRSYIANLLRLLTLPDVVQDMVRKGELSAGHARALITSENPEALARQIVRNGLSVRQAEKLAKGTEPKKLPAGNVTRLKDADTRRLEQDLGAALGKGVTVSIDHNLGTESGVISVRYKDLGQLDEICRRLSAITDTGPD